MGARWQKRDVASLGREKVNDVWSAFGERTIVRWSSSRTRYSSKCGDTLLQKLNPAADFDLFHGIRDANEWTSERLEQSRAGGVFSHSSDGADGEQFRTYFPGNGKCFTTAADD